MCWEAFGDENCFEGIRNMLVFILAMEGAVVEGAVVEAIFEFEKEEGADLKENNRAEPMNDFEDFNTGVCF